MDGVIRFLLRHLDSRNLKNWKITTRLRGQCWVGNYWMTIPTSPRGVLYKRVLRFYDRGGKITNNVRVVLDPVYDLLLKEQA
ncbi:hypothetical protein FRC0132_00055 [Corynebacterium diphtheriae]|nr:hypothetical protein FRC0132_00055 [Corynebacterium diphtheriae]